MDKTQILAIEITDKCNRGREHNACPNMHPARWMHSVGRRPMTDDQIVGIAKEMYAGGFCGWVAFHHYCEPLADWPRVQRIIARIKEETGKGDFLLWTNGDLLPRNLQDLAVFGKMVVSNYSKRNVEELRTVCPDVAILNGDLDWRLNPPQCFGSSPCLRPFLEIVFDYYGNVRACCNDWTNEIQIGNIHDTPFSELWERWLKLRSSVMPPNMNSDAPERCRRCGTRYIHFAAYAGVPYNNALEYLKDRL